MLVKGPGIVFRTVVTPSTYDGTRRVKEVSRRWRERPHRSRAEGVRERTTPAWLGWSGQVFVLASFLKIFGGGTE
jgi:hypothetical protein